MDAGLWQAVHAFANFHKDAVVVNEGLESVLEHDVRWDVAHRDPHVFLAIHGVVKVEVLDIKRGKPGTRGGDYAVEQELGSGQVGGFSADVTGVVDLVTATGEADTFFFVLVGLVLGNDAKVSGFAPDRKVRERDEPDGVGTRWHVGKHTLGQPPYFVGRALAPFGAVGATKELVVSWRRDREQWGRRECIGPNGPSDCWRDRSRQFRPRWRGRNRQCARRGYVVGCGWRQGGVLKDAPPLEVQGWGIF
jgi:hypothetical protein